MTDIVLIASVATGASAVLGGGVGVPLYFRGKRLILKRGISEWHQQYYSAKEALENIVMNGVTPSNAMKEAEYLRGLLGFYRPILKGYEPSRSMDRYYSFQEPSHMALTHIYKTDAEIKKAIPLMHPSFGLSDSEISAAMAELKCLLKTAALVETEDPWIHDFCQFVQEYAAHLLINFRPSPQTDSKPNAKKDAEGMRRQKVLNMKAVDLEARAQAILDHQMSDTAKVMGNSLEAAKTKIEADRAVTVAAAVKSTPTLAVKEVEPAPSLPSIVVPKGLLRDDEQSVVDGFLRQMEHLSKECQVTGNQAIEKLVESATLAGKAHHFSEATRDQVLAIAEENRALAVSEIAALTEQTAPAEELEALYTLRVSNKYLASRHSERTEAKQTA